VVRIITSKQ